MTRHGRHTLLAALTAFALLLSGTACNKVGNKEDWSEAVVQGQSVTYTGLKASDSEPATAVLTFAVRDRNQSNLSTSSLNAIEFDTFTVTYTIPAPSVATGVSQGVFYQVGSTGNIILFGLGIPEVAGNCAAFHVRFDGHDNLGRPVSWDVDAGACIAP